MVNLFSETEDAHHFRNRQRGFLKGFEDADGEAAHAGEVFRAEAGADATAVFLEFLSSPTRIHLRAKPRSAKVRCQDLVTDLDEARRGPSKLMLITIPKERCNPEPAWAGAR